MDDLRQERHWEVRQRKRGEEWRERKSEERRPRKERRDAQVKRGLRKLVVNMGMEDAA